MKYVIKKNSTKVNPSLIEGSELTPLKLYESLRLGNIDSSFVIMHSEKENSHIYMDDHAGKHGYIVMSDTYKHLSELGFSKDDVDEGLENIAGPFKDLTVKVDSYDGFFRDFVLNLPMYEQLEHDALPAGITSPFSVDHGIDYESFDLIIEF